MSYRKKNRFSLKKSNVQTFLFFLLFTSMLWLFTQFSKNYTQEVEVTIKYTNIPKDRIVNAKSDQSLKMVLNGNGFRLIGHNWSKSILNFSVEDAFTTTSNKYSFFVNKETLLLNNKLDFKGKVLSIQKDTLELYLDYNLKKKVPVYAKRDIEYAVGYGSDQGLVLKPDSITVSGPSQIVGSINQVHTEKVDLKGLNVDHTAKLRINTEELPSDILVIPSRVDATVLVSKFTEGHQKVPITIRNAPDGMEIKIFPTEISVVYRVGLDKYNEVSPRDFVVIADYAKVSEESSFLTVELVEKPGAIHDVRLQEKQVQFVVLKQ
ncbi:YbbR-like domain-containing protein [Aquimarina sp. 2201CG1-2-11]|uniref:CdaR family protein n=1 Tax=Aquimarina discodermiae TaxID=3231043 RepID=UPI003462106D